MKHAFIYFLLILLQVNELAAQGAQVQVSGKGTRKIHYMPAGQDFLTINGYRLFNRALYGSNTAFRSEAGDKPEFALYLPGMGGNLKFGLIRNDSSKWLINATTTAARYRPGSMLYSIEDDLLSKGKLHITALSLYDREGLIVKVEAKGLSGNVQLLAAFGGATGQRFSREGDIGADPESSFYLKPEYCRDNIYQLDQNTFTLFFGAKKPLTEEERYEIQYLSAKATDSASIAPMKNLSGIFPPATLKLADAAAQQSPLQLFSSAASATPVLVTQFALVNDSVFYFLLLNGKNEKPVKYADLPSLFAAAELTRSEIAGRTIVNTPDPYINTLGGALSIAADAIWEDPSYMHGAVAWRMRLNGWRGAYAADLLGWHERARKHFDSYALSQLTSPLTAPVVMDTALHLARSREKLGTSLFSSGYICRNPNGDFRPHHYDMNLVFIDQLLNHFLWTGDTAYVKKMWPLLTRHLDWEKRNFDMDGDGLYDAYAAIWASDALQYSGGGVTHSSAYNYRSNKMAAELAVLIGEDPAPYEKEATGILKAINGQLWMPDKGWYAEYKDLLGKKLLHPAAALWTIYHAIDSRVPDIFQSYQALHYVDTEIPRISLGASGMEDTSSYTISTSNWQPYTWSLNNVVLGEVLHTALAYWQAGRNEQAYVLWKSALLESMYLGASPGNIHQLSYYDAIRGELYRDFADDIGMAARSLVEGLFGIFPDALRDTLYISPGFPAAWDHASIHTPDIDFSFKKNGNKDSYELSHHLPGKMNVLLRVKAGWDDVESVTVDGREINWIFEENAIGLPVLRVVIPASGKYVVEITWKGKVIEQPVVEKKYAKGQVISITTRLAQLSKVYDPQHVLDNITQGQQQVRGMNRAGKGNKTFFIKATQGKAGYWIPISFNSADPVEVSLIQEKKGLRVDLYNNTPEESKGKLFINNKYLATITMAAGSSYRREVTQHLVPGSNSIRYESGKDSFNEKIVNWDINSPDRIKYEKIDLSAYFNEVVTNIFKNQYLSPRPVSSTLQLPTQGIGNWAYPLIEPIINDSGLRKRAVGKNEIMIKQGVPFAVDAQPGKRNIAFTSQWDNFPDSLIIPLKGRASHAYLLMAGSTNPMQSRMVNAEVLVHYKGGSSEKLELKNPENWWPIEQDYFVNGLAFTTDAPKPVRVYLKTGEDTRDFDDFISLRGFSSRGIDGGAATVLDLSLDPGKEIESIEIKSITNDVVVGLMSLTLARP